eukprot:3069083-Prymnesium_polylepis.1
MCRRRQPQCAAPAWRRMSTPGELRSGRGARVSFRGETKLSEMGVVFWGGVLRTRFGALGYFGKGLCGLCGHVPSIGLGAK